MKDEKRDICDIKDDGNFCQADELVLATSLLSPIAAKVFYTLLAKRVPGDSIVSISIYDVLTTLGLSDSAYNYGRVKEALEELKSLQIEVKIQAGIVDAFSDLPPDRMIRRVGTLLPTYDVDDTSGYYLIYFNQQFIPLYDTMNNDYTWAYIDDLRKINGVMNKGNGEGKKRRTKKSEYAPRAYLWVQMRLGNQDKYRTIWYVGGKSEKSASIRQYFGIPDGKYKQARDLIRKVVVPAFEIINSALGDKVMIQYQLMKNEGSGSIYALDVTLTSLKKQKRQKKEQLQTARDNGDVLDADYTETAASQLDYTKKTDETTAERVVAYFNRKVGKKCKATAYKAKIERLMKDYSEEDILKSIDNAMDKYQNYPSNLNLNTILKPNIFDSLLNYVTEKSIGGSCPYPDTFSQDWIDHHKQTQEQPRSSAEELVAQILEYDRSEENRRREKESKEKERERCMIYRYIDCRYDSWGQLTMKLRMNLETLKDVPEDFDPYDHEDTLRTLDRTLKYYRLDMDAND